MAFSVLSLIEYFSTTFLNPSVLCVRQIRAYRAPRTSRSPLLIIGRNYICRTTMAVVTRFRHEIEIERKKNKEKTLSVCVL
jgi:hypothetical protein